MASERRIFVVEAIQHTRWFPYSAHLYRSQAQAFIRSVGDLSEFYRIRVYGPQKKREER